MAAIERESNPRPSG